MLKRIWRTRWGVGATTIVVLAAAGALIALLVTHAHPQADKLICANNLRRINLALMNYELSKGHPAVAYSVSSDLEPLLSWQVLLLPYLEESDLAREFDQTAAWNSPQNTRLADNLPDAFHCLDDDSLGRYSSYAAVVDDHVASAPQSAPSILGVVEFMSPRPWTAPYAIPVSKLEQMSFLQAGKHRGFHVLFNDGTIEYFTSENELTGLAKMLRAKQHCSRTSHTPERPH